MAATAAHLPPPARLGLRRRSRAHDLKGNQTGTHPLRRRDHGGSWSRAGLATHASSPRAHAHARLPTPKTLHETNLPIPATPFVGRERELEEIAALLRRPDVRLVTLTGAGGSGKTRLSLQAAAAAADDFQHGVWWVSLASLADPELVDTAAAQALGSNDDEGESHAFTRIGPPI